MTDSPEGLPPSLEAAINFDERGLVAAIAQQQGSGEILMMAWMNRESLSETLKTGQVCYWSRSRGKLWRKGETSGQTQHLKSLSVDCDGDTLLLTVEQNGVACHTGRRSCFFRQWNGQKLEDVLPVVQDPETLYGR
ncbi:phosphoribosyl-AMP cyclohydrolase [Limibacillus sp. MBR-115]|jgi:phosphoribosyl-AMP cyclohydrolase|uniref:phosphoribosyl-AMP cyclohydrolase n=1 Tax=Limibacillus sp. MBR-115 TaxID=3156465 RepID=UPI00339AD05C